VGWIDMDNDLLVGHFDHFNFWVT